MGNKNENVLLFLFSVLTFPMNYRKDNNINMMIEIVSGYLIFYV